MSRIQNIDQKIHRLYLKVDVATGYKKENATPEYFHQICQIIHMFELDISALVLSGFVFNEDSKRKINHLKKLACE